MDKTYFSVLFFSGKKHTSVFQRPKGGGGTREDRDQDHKTTTRREKQQEREGEAPHEAADSRVSSPDRTLYTFLSRALGGRTPSCARANTQRRGGQRGRAHARAESTRAPHTGPARALRAGLPLPLRALWLADVGRVRKRPCVCVSKEYPRQRVHCVCVFVRFFHPTGRIPKSKMTARLAPPTLEKKQPRACVCLLGRGGEECSRKSVLKIVSGRGGGPLCSSAWRRQFSTAWGSCLRGRAAGGKNTSPARAAPGAASLSLIPLGVFFGLEFPFRRPQCEGRSSPCKCVCVCACVWVGGESTAKLNIFKAAEGYGVSRA
jgi:hypothetical protein